MRHFRVVAELRADPIEHLAATTGVAQYAMKEPGEYVIGSSWAVHVEPAGEPLPPPEKRTNIANMICTPARVVVKARN